MLRRYYLFENIAFSFICTSICAFVIFKLIPFLEIDTSILTFLKADHAGFQRALNQLHFLKGTAYLFTALGSLSAVCLFNDLLKLVFSFTAKGKVLMAQAEANEAIRIAEENIQSAQRYKEYQLREEILSRDESNSSSGNDSFMSPTSPIWSHSNSGSSGGWSGGDSGGWSGGSCDSGSSGGGDCGGGGD